MRRWPPVEFRITLACLAGAGVIVFLLTLPSGCANDSELAYAPLPPAPVVGWLHNFDGTPPTCLNASSVTDIDIPEQRTRTCVWECAYYWTEDGNIGPRRYEKTWVYIDGQPAGSSPWGSYAGQFWHGCDAHGADSSIFEGGLL